MKSRRLLDSFNYAIKGVIHAIIHERNVKVHFFIAFIVFILSLYFRINRTELIMIILASMVVIVAEMMNTSIENMVNLLTDTQHPLARIAKDVAAGGVLVASLGAITIGYLVFFEQGKEISLRLGETIKSLPTHVTVITLLLVVCLVMAGKALGKHGSPLRGGVVSGHTALAFAAATIIWLISSYLVSTLAFLLAFLVSHSRVESEIHSWWEVVIGALIGSLTALVIYKMSGSPTILGS